MPENVFYSFFWLQCFKEEFILFVSSKNQTACKLITFDNNWCLNSPRETAVDIALDVSENSHSIAYSEVLSEVVAYQNGIY